MPKEITHWLIAERVAAGLLGSPLGSIVAEHKNCLKLGAVFHDALFYIRKRSLKKSVLALAEELHGADGEDTFAVLAYFIEALGRSARPDALGAFTIGLLSHIVTDATFHPLVYYLTGNYYDPDPEKRSLAVQRHRRFESMLDIYLCGSQANMRDFALCRYIQEAEYSLQDILREGLGGLEAQKHLNGLPQALSGAFGVFSSMQRLYRKRPLCRLLSAVLEMLPAGGKEIAALFYLPEFERRATELHGPLSFRNPVSGQQHRATVQELFEVAVQESVRLCQLWEPAIMGQAPFHPPGPGRSLDCGIANTPIQAAKFFSEQD
ncbi:zinc dependent phospholipase C family protein [Thermodesulfobacteriota bacterium]